MRSMHCSSALQRLTASGDNFVGMKAPRLFGEERHTRRKKKKPCCTRRLALFPAALQHEHPRGSPRTNDQTQTHEQVSSQELLTSIRCVSSPLEYLRELALPSLVLRGLSVLRNSWSSGDSLVMWPPTTGFRKTCSSFETTILRLPVSQLQL